MLLSIDSLDGCWTRTPAESKEQSTKPFVVSDIAVVIPEMVEDHFISSAPFIFVHASPFREHLYTIWTGLHKLNNTPLIYKFTLHCPSAASADLPLLSSPLSPHISRQCGMFRYISYAGHALRNRNERGLVLSKLSVKATTEDILHDRLPHLYGWEICISAYSGTITNYSDANSITIDYYK
jgi:hypothetical protein